MTQPTNQWFASWIVKQSPAIIIALIFSYGFWELLHDQAESYQAQLQRTHERYAIRFERMILSHEREVAAYAKAYRAMSTVMSQIDRRVEVMSVDIQLINGRSRQTLQKIKEHVPFSPTEFNTQGP